MNKLYRMRMVDRLNGIGPQGYRMVNRLSGGIPDGELPATALRIGMSGLRGRTGPSGLRGLGAYVCQNGVAARTDGGTSRPLTFLEAMNTISADRAKVDYQFLAFIIKVAEQWKANPNSIPSATQAKVIAKANEMICAGYYTQLNQAALAHRDAVNAAIAANQALTAEQMGYQVQQQTVAGAGSGSAGSSAGSGSASAGAAATGADTFATWFSGGGNPPGGDAIAANLPGVLLDESGGINWILIAAIAAGGYFLLKKK